MGTQASHPSGRLTSLKVLITNIQLFSPTGTELYVRDLAVELQRRGHRPFVYTPRPGLISKQLCGMGIPGR